MRFVSTALLAALVLAASVVPVAAATPLKGTVKTSFTANGQNGRVTKTFSTTSPHVYASFVWLHAPTAGQRMTVDWFGPSGKRIAEWSSKTLATDMTGTRIFSFIGKKTIAALPGKWRVALTVGGVERSSLRFTVVKP